jgi:hypothetical protein
MAVHVDYDTDLRIIYVTTAPVDDLVTIDVQIDLYSDMKEDWRSTPALNKFVLPIRSVGGDALPGSKTLGDTYFLADDWKIRPYEADHKLALNGNLFAEDGTSVTVTTIGSYQVLVEMFVSNLSDASLVGGDIWTANLGEEAHNENEDTSGHLLYMTRYLQKYVYVDPELVDPGDGSSLTPFNNITDAIDFAEGHSLRDLVALSEITLDRDLKNFNIIGIGAPVVNCGGVDLKGSEFLHCTMRGTYTDSIIAQQSVLDDGFLLNGFFENCALYGDLTCVVGGAVLLKEVTSIMPGATNPSISLNGAGSSSLSISGYSGELNIKNCTNAADSVKIELQGKVTLESTCTDGLITIMGVAELVDNSNGSTVVVSSMVDTVSALQFVDLIVAKEI